MNLLPQTMQGLQALNYPFAATEKTLAELIGRYLLLIEKWNKVHNLTAIRHRQDMLYQHVMDSLSVLPYINGPQIIDVGSGAGLPGIPIALARPDWHVTLIESNKKKAAFLQQVKIELALRNLEIMAARVEHARIDRQVNTIITRAFSELGQFIALTRQWAVKINVNCRWVAMKANCLKEEQNQVQDPFEIEKIVTVTVPGLDAARQLIIIKTTDLED
ncbi:MAG: 16S rRNA (guanine(527)-N(7))-methyltransferase RsmG [Nitrosomonas sp. PRO4]|nr:16S rRNA (guanine(527)-N(7))-methyltransferase RsmG [Nitrosomonas sp. PRO4]